VLGVGLFLVVEVLLNRPMRIGEEGQFGADGGAELLCRVVSSVEIVTIWV
jgi:hypothetical protein